MSTAVRNLLDTFESLPIGDQHQTIVEILRRAGDMEDVSDEGLAIAADELFCTMDAEEARHATS